MPLSVYEPPATPVPVIVYVTPLMSIAAPDTMMPGESTEATVSVVPLVVHVISVTLEMRRYSAVPLTPEVAKLIDPKVPGAVNVT